MRKWGRTASRPRGEGTFLESLYALRRARFRFLTAIAAGLGGTGPWHLPGMRGDVARCGARIYEIYAAAVTSASCATRSLGRAVHQTIKAPTYPWTCLGSWVLASERTGPVKFVEDGERLPDKGKQRLYVGVVMFRPSCIPSARGGRQRTPCVGIYLATARGLLRCLRSSSIPMGVLPSTVRLANWALGNNS